MGRGLLTGALAGALLLACGTSNDAARTSPSGTQVQAGSCASIEKCGLPATNIESTTIDEASFDLPACAAGDSTGIIRFGGAAVRGLGLDADYVELRSSSGQSLDHEGTPCKTATDSAVCNAKLADASSKCGWPSTANASCADTVLYLVTTKGDAVDVIVDDPTLMARLGRIDSVPKARLLLALRTKGYPSPCASSRLRALPGGGYEALGDVRVACGPGRAYHNVYRVTPDGQVTEIAREEYGDPVPHCPG